MKKMLVLAASLAVMGSLMACGAKTADSGTQTSAETDITSANQTAQAGAETGTSNGKAILIINGNLGDLGFFDSANAGIQRVKNEQGLEIQVIETGDDESKWEPALADAAEEDADYIIAVSPSMVEPMQNVAPLYPEKKFIMMDNTVDYTKGDFSNVYCATFKQNEGSFLAGTVAGLLAESGKIGFVGGMDIPPINDFLVGYIEGAKAVNPDIKVSASYVGDYYDPAKGKEHGIVMANQGVDVMFAAAGPSGLGVIEAAVDADRWVIGVDSDQAAGYLANGNQKTADKIATSMMKNVGDAIYRAIELDRKGELKFGQVESLGIAEGGVGLAKNDIYKAALTDEQQKKVDEIQTKVVSGEIKVDSAIGMTTDQLNQIKNSVAP